MDITQVGSEALDSIEPLWASMVAHHRGVVGETLPVRDADESWPRRRRQYESWLSDGSGTLYSAAVGGELVGYAMLRIATSGPSFDFGERYGDVESLAVRPDVRGSGVGSALLSACRHELLRLGVEWWMISVVEANEGAIRLYEREGFAPFYRTLAGRVE